MNHTPVAIGLLICEQVIVEEKTRNVTPVNCFTHRKVVGFPSEPFPFVVFSVLADGLGEMPLEVRIYRLDTFGEVYRTVAATIRFTDPLQSVRFQLRIRDVSFPVPGHYDVALLADGEMIAQRKLVILQKETAT